MQKFLLGMCALLVFCGFAATNAKADALTIGGGFSAYDEVVGAGNAFAETWTFSGPAMVTVTDFDVVGDEFAVYDNGHFLFDTSTVADWTAVPGCDGNPYDASCGYQPDPTISVTDPNFSHGSMNVGTGSHSITIDALTLPTGFGDSTVAIELTASTATPETSSLLLLATGLIALGALAFFTRGRRVQTAACPA